MKRFLLGLILLSNVVLGQTVVNYSNEFMNIGVDAAAFGMSNAVVASTSDVNSGYWNPAGLINLEDNQLALMHANYFANIAQYDYAAFAMPIDEDSAWGISLIRFGVDDILNTTQLIDAGGVINFDNVSLFSAADYGVTFSYARNLKIPGFSWGANAKVIRRVIGDFAKSWGVGFDLGFQFKRSNWEYGIMLRDITTTYNTWQIDEDALQTSNPNIPEQRLPETMEITKPKMQLGIARNFTFHYDYTLRAELDLNMRFAETNDIFSTSAVSFTPAVGLEFGYTDLVFVRAGVGNFQNTPGIDGSDETSFQPNLGVGFKYKGIQIDYSLTDLGDQSAAIYSNVFSIKIDWTLFR
ncbi:PorV/PorQ family protein [Sungkyunkwania multivorans]|uniref:PorV/PorQ family protein n=1 Tax=Sungkyunkwania multivorans TaxID=1173618 RepID=A0ABW3D4M7_9FLAO